MLQSSEKPVINCLSAFLTQVASCYGQDVVFIILTLHETSAYDVQKFNVEYLQATLVPVSCSHYCVASFLHCMCWYDTSAVKYFKAYMSPVTANTEQLHDVCTLKYLIVPPLTAVPSRIAH